MLKYRGVTKEGLKQTIQPYLRLFSNLKEKKISAIQILPKLPTRDDKKDVGVLKINGLYKIFGNHEVLTNINLTIEPKKITAIIGASGSGKTTILKSIIGFHRPTKGVISYKNQNIFENIDFIRRSFGFAAQDDSFYFKLNVEENVKYFGKLYGLTDGFLEMYVSPMLKLVDLYDARFTLAENLSTGMRRRLDIACALIHDPSVLILDEPTQDLDPHLRNEILNLIKEINKRGTTIVFTSHLLEEVDLIADNVAILAEGKILQTGSPNKIKDSYSKNKEIHLYSLPGRYKKVIGRMRGVKKVTYEDGRAILHVSDVNGVVKKLISNLKRNREDIVDLTIRKPNLTEVFEHLTRNAKSKK